MGEAALLQLKLYRPRAFGGVVGMGWHRASAESAVNRSRTVAPNFGLLLFFPQFRWGSKYGPLSVYAIRLIGKQGF